MMNVNKLSVLALALCLLMGCATLNQGEQPVETKEGVYDLAQKTGIINANGTAPKFSDKDLAYWADKSLTRKQLVKQFLYRQKVLLIAKSVDYRIKTQGDWSALSEALESREVTAGGLKQELLAKKQREAIAASRPKVLSEEAIFNLAEKFGLTRTDGFAPVFEEGDASYWEELNLDESSIQKEFGNRSRIVELAKQSGYHISTQGDLSYFSEKLMGEKATDQMIIEEFSRKTFPLSGETPHFSKS